MLSPTISRESFQPVRWWSPQISEIDSLMEHIEFPQR
jgi:hypothetical protein